MALENGMRTLRMDGIDKVFRGITDIDEIVRVC
jgi:type II secretory ATPase GspE/PulE/Tfp pilus assembly ATPase PilB-like protein